MKKVIIHGEVNFFDIDELPKGLKQIEVKNDFFVVGESETHGNDHRVMVKDKLEVMFYEDENSVLYMKNLKPTEVFCPKDNRHSTTTITPGIRKIKKSREIDHVTERIRDVRD